MPVRPRGLKLASRLWGRGSNSNGASRRGRVRLGARLGAVETGVAVRLWPNPARDHVLIDLSPVIGQPVGLQLNDLLGHPLQHTKLEMAPAEPYRLNTSQLPDGLYLIQVTPAGQSPTTLRLLIQR